MIEWIKWSGGECPVKRDQRVEVRLRCGVASVMPAEIFEWQHTDHGGDIVEYRLIDAATPAVIDPKGDEHEALTFGQMPAGMKDSNPKDSAASGRVPMHMVPDTLVLYAAMAFAEGDSKYIAFNFRVAGVRASVYISALRRHLMRYVNGEWADKKTKVPHLASVAACVAILIDGHVTKTIVDDRPPAVDLGEEMDRAEEVIAHVYAMNRDKRPVDVSYTIADTGAVA